ncbi:MAG: hypothetical protein E3K36_10635 [Candidatus Brocadia sp.]|nr:hypothetical protein [Candidatus Brocadia sp.]
MKTLLMNTLKTSKNIACLITCNFLLLVLFGCAQSPQHDETETYFGVLDNIKITKKRQIIDYFNKIKQTVHGVNKDDKILHCFTVMRNYYNSNPTRADAPSLYKLEYEMDVHYVKKYGDFYDILFVDNKGFVFHSIKHEADYHTNLFTGQFSDTQLAKHMKNNPDSEFVDYEFYFPSDEPAAFFLKPVQENNEMLGWLALQFPINKINAILSDHEGLGRTGEVYLVNKNKLMLTDSRFIEDSTILKLKIDTEAIRLALTRETGKMIINDYRGVRVLSSFEQFDVFGHSWIIIAEIDEDEAVSNHYQRHKKFYLPRIVEYYTNMASKINASGKEMSRDKKGKRVDMNEFCMTRSGEVLETQGVGPCTSIIIYYPKKFGYLVHISPTDEIYQKPLLVKYLPWGKKTCLLEELIKRIQYYDIYPYQLKDLQFVIIATHDKSLETIINQLYKAGVNLAQIKFLYNPLANYANVAFNQSDDSVSVEWLSQNGGKASFSEHASAIDSIGSIVKKITIQ